MFFRYLVQLRSLSCWRGCCERFVDSKVLLALGAFLTSFIAGPLVIRG